MPFEWPAQAEARRKEELRAALAEHAHRAGDRWWFSSPEHTHSEETALQIVEACQTLGRRITDVITTEAWWTLVSRVVDLEKRVGELEQAARDRQEYEWEMKDRNDG